MSAFQNFLAYHVPLNLWVEIIDLGRGGRKGGPFQSFGVGSCLTLGNELSEEAHILTKQETAGKEGCLVGSSRARGPGELLCQVARSLRFYDKGISFQVVSGQSSCLVHIWWLRVLPGGGGISQPNWIPVLRASGRLGQDISSFWPLLNSSG